LRKIEKWAVRIGGGTNHRMGLYDMVMLKENHIDYAGGIEPAINKAITYLKKIDKKLPIEVETRNLTELKEVLTVGGIQRIMLDNFSLTDLKEAVSLINGKYETEASGGINLETVRKIAETGVDFVSVGALTHTVKSLDISMLVIA
jgi:nicotinate-nucleotide pyrophosphorylase (carboxylating)